MNSYATSSFTLGLAHDIGRLTSSNQNNPASDSVGLLFSIVLSLFNSGQNYDQEFQNINNKLDMIEMQLGDLSNLIKNVAINNIYFDSASNINYQMRKLMEYMQSNASTKEVKRNEFIRAYENTGEDKHVWIIHKNLQHFLNIFAETSNYNKTYITSIGKGLMETLMMGVSCSYSYEYLKSRSYNQVLIRWRNRLVESYAMTKDYEDKCVRMAPTSAEKLIKRHLAYYGTTNQQGFTNSLHQLLNSTYDWLSWMVLVYDGDVQSSLNVYSCCNGIHVKGNKNVVAFYAKKQKIPSSHFNALHAALNRYFRPRVIASRMYNFLRDKDVKGPIFVCRVIYGITYDYDRSYGKTARSGRLFIANFVS